VALAESLWVLKAALSIHDLYPLFLMEAKIASFDTQHSTEGSSTQNSSRDRRRLPCRLLRVAHMDTDCNITVFQLPTL